MSPAEAGSPSPGSTREDAHMLEERIDVLEGRLRDAEAYLDLAGTRAAAGMLELEAARPDLWDDAEAARAVMKQLGKLHADVALLEGLARELSDVRTLRDLAAEEGDAVELAEAARSAAKLAARLDELELRSLLAGEYDESDAVAEIHAGAGGTDAQDWAEMVLRMYERWAERHEMDVELDDVTPGQEAGIQSATFIVRGRFAYGMLSCERGVHRLVRMSPFNSAHSRETSFASFDVVPFSEEVDSEVAIDEGDLRIDTYRSSGAGGQHVNVTDSAVRITHLPSGIVVSCQNERSQHQNKARAMQILAARLAELARERRKASLDALTGPQATVAWGNQIRSYVLAPYQMVKDHRTEEETGNVAAVLDGGLDAFIEAYLHLRRATAGGRDAE